MRKKALFQSVVSWLGVSAAGFAGVSAAGLLFSGCGGPKAFTKGEYDDPNRVELLDDRFNEADMQQMAKSMVDAMVGCRAIVAPTKPPVVIMEKVRNDTEEHIDMVSMTDMIRNNLINSGKVRFINKTERGTLEDEYAHNASGAVSAETQKKRGRQIGADFIMGGALSTNVQQVGNDKFVYYKLTMNLTNLETSVMECTNQFQSRKKFRKRSVGL